MVVNTQDSNFKPTAYFTRSKTKNENLKQNNWEEKEGHERSGKYNKFTAYNIIVGANVFIKFLWTLAASFYDFSSCSSLS